MAFGRVIELGEAQALLGQPVYPWCLDFAPVTSEIGEAQVIHHHQEDVGRFFPRGGHWGEAEKEQEQSRQHYINMRSGPASFKCKEAGRLVCAYEKARRWWVSGLGVNQQRVLWFVICKVAARAGFEPATKWLTATCSTTELPSNLSSGKQEIRGLAPALSMGFWEDLRIGSCDQRNPLKK